MLDYPRCSECSPRGPGSVLMHSHLFQPADLTSLTTAIKGWLASRSSVTLLLIENFDQNMENIKQEIDVNTIVKTEMEDHVVEVDPFEEFAASYDFQDSGQTASASPHSNVQAENPPAPKLENPNKHLVSEDLQQLIIQQNTDRKIQFTFSQRMNNQMVLDDFVLKKKKGPYMCRNGRTVNWRCTLESCQYTAVTWEGSIKEESKEQHNHPANPELLAKKQARAKLRENMTLHQSPVSHMVMDVVTETNPEHRQGLGSVEALKQAARRINRKLQGHVPTPKKRQIETDENRFTIEQKTLKYEDVVKYEVPDDSFPIEDNEFHDNLAVAYRNGGQIELTDNNTLSYATDSSELSNGEDGKPKPVKGGIPSEQKKEIKLIIEEFLTKYPEISSRDIKKVIRKNCLRDTTKCPENCVCKIEKSTFSAFVDRNIKNFKERGTMERKPYNGGKPLEIDSLICVECGFIGRDKKHLYHHTHRNHGKEKACEECGEMVKAGDREKHNLSKHTEKTFYCKDCGKNFKTKNNLRNHEVIHGEARPFPCRFSCGFASKTSGNRSIHERTCSHRIIANDVSSFADEHGTESYGNLQKEDCVVDMDPHGEEFAPSYEYQEYGRIFAHNKI